MKLVPGKKDVYMLDARDKKMVAILKRNGRIPLTKMAKPLNLSIKSTHERMQKLIKAKIIMPTIRLDERKIGYEIVAEVRIKLKNTTKENKKRLIAYLINHPHILTVVSVMGDWDLTIVMTGENIEEISKTTDHLRDRFSNMINDWSSAFTLKTHKLEDLIV